MTIKQIIKMLEKYDKENPEVQLNIKGVISLIRGLTK
jgi:hypothetical protein